MKHLKKRYIVLISVLALLLVGNLVFFFVTAGKTAEKDGLLQNSRLYMRDVYYADGEIHYVLVNDTPWQSVISYYATVQKLENGEWVDIPFCRSEPESALVLKGFGERACAIPLEYEYEPVTQLIGEYRLIEQVRNGVCYVGYFSITAEMLP